MREMQKNDPIHPVRHKAGTKPARRAKKHHAEMERKHHKHSKEDLMKAHHHMAEHMR